MARVLVTGGSGFLGSLLVQRLLGDGHTVTSVDLLPATFAAPNFTAVVGDIRDAALLDRVMPGHEAVFHCAALLAHGTIKPRDLWASNVEGTRVLAQATKAAGIRSLVYISSNCLWARGFDRPVREDDAPAPCEIYGASKLEGERILAAHAGDFATTVIRSPTIIDEGRRVWLVGEGSNRYQFIYAKDLIAAMLLAWRQGASGVFGIGADEVGSMRETFEHVIAHAGTAARTAHLPLRPTLLAMRAAHALRVSPLGPYHYRMIAESFVFDTAKIKADLGWRPTLTNGDMLLAAYRYYVANRAEIAGRSNVSAHRRPADMGVIRVLKWVS